MDFIDGLIKTIQKHTNSNDLGEINSLQCKAAIQRYLSKSFMAEPKPKKTAPLSAANKKKVQKVKKRADALDQGVTKQVVVPVKIDLTAYWNEGTECSVYANEQYESKSLADLQKKFKQEIDKEIKDIIKFSDRLAKQLGEDEKEFWVQHFLN